MCLLWQKNKSTLYFGCLGTQAHDLVTIQGRRCLHQRKLFSAQFLDQRRSGSFIFDQDNLCAMKRRQLSNKSLEVREFEFVAEDIQKKQTPIF